MISCGAVMRFVCLLTCLTKFVKKWQDKPQFKSESTEWQVLEAAQVVMVTLLWYQEKTLVSTTALLVSLQNREVLALMEDVT